MSGDALPGLGSPMIVRDGNVTFRELQGGGSILDDRTGEYHSLNMTAALIWTLLDEPIALEELVDILGAAANAPAHQVGVEVRAFVDELASLGLVTLTPTPG